MKCALFVSKFGMTVFGSHINLLSEYPKKVDCYTTKANAQSYTWYNFHNKY